MVYERKEMSFFNPIDLRIFLILIYKIFQVFFTLSLLSFSAQAKEDVKLPSGNSPWKFKKWEVFASDNLSAYEIKKVPKLQGRPLWTPWRKHTEFEVSDINTSIKTIERYLEIEGFYNAELDLSWKENKIWTASVNILEGQRLKIKDVKWVLPDPLDGFPIDLLDRLTLKPGGYFSEFEFQEDQQKILSYYLNQGHLWVKVKPAAQLSKKELSASIRFIITPGPKTNFGETEIKGLRDISPKLILREFVHQQGDQYNARDLIQTRANLIRTRWFRSVILTPKPGTKEGQDPVPLLLELEEAEPRTIGIGLGVGSEEGPRTRINWTHRNWLKRGWQNRVQLEASFLELNFRSTVDIPRAFLPDGHAQGILSYGLYNEDEYDVLIGEIEGNWSYDVLEKTPATFGWSIKQEDHSTEASVLTALNNPAELALMTGPYVTIGRSGDYGKWGSWSLSSTTRSMHDLSGYRASFWKQTLTYHATHPVRGKWTFHPRLKLGWMDAWGNHSIPVVERFYTGGSKSVRGYSRRNIGPRTNNGFQLGGKSLSEFTLELQHPFFLKNLIGALFWDGGQLDLKPSGLQLSDYRYGVGGGLGYKLPMGVMRLDLGIPLKRKEWESSFQIHFDFGATF